MATSKERENQFSSFIKDEILSPKQCNILICHHFPVHIRATQTEYSFVCASGLHSTYCSPQGIYRNGASAYICTCGVVEYPGSGNVTTVVAQI